MCGREDFEPCIMTGHYCHFERKKKGAYPTTIMDEVHMHEESREMIFSGYFRMDIAQVRGQTLAKSKQTKNKSSTGK